MTKDELIAKQQLEIESQKSIIESNRELANDIKMMFVAIGQPLNDNVLMFNRDQLKWCQRVYDKIEELEY